MNKPLLSICSITYNHEKFIAQAIESWLMQKTDFDIEIVIGEDCSTDNTLKIIKEYQAKHPDLIRVITSDHNVGMQANFVRTLNACQGKYIALCEGDDYWTEPYKLQKQVDFLEKNETFSICFHPVKVINEKEEEVRISNSKTETETEVYDLIKENYLYTTSVVFRNNRIEMPNWFLKAPIGDWPLHLLNAKFGKIKKLNQVMAVYRLHSGGVFSTKDTWILEKEIQHQKRMIGLYENLMYEFKYEEFAKYEFENKIVAANNSLRINLILINKIKESQRRAKRIVSILGIKVLGSKLGLSVLIHSVSPRSYSKYLKKYYEHKKI